MATASTVKVRFLGDASDLAKAAKKASTAVEEVGTKSHGLRNVFAGLGGAALGAGLVEFGKKSLEAAVEGEQAQARLAQAVKNTGGSMDDLEPKVHDLSGRFAKFGFTNDQVESALAAMTTSLGSSEKAMSAMGLAADLAKFKHIDLTTASIAVAKAMEGQLRPLKQLGIDLPVSAAGALKLEQANTAVAVAQAHVTDVLKKYPDAAKAASKHHDLYAAATAKVTAAQTRLTAVQGAAKEITDKLTHAIGGQATAAAGTTAGKLAALHAQMANVSEQVGTKLLPVVIRAISYFEKLAAFVDRNRKVIVPLATALGAIGGTLWIVVKATKAYTAVQAALNVVMDANPIGLVIIAVAALAVGIVLLWKHSATFRKIVTGAFKAVGDAASAMWNVIRPVLKFWADTWLLVVGALVHGAAAAFGWVPGIGGKLKSAAKEFDKFKAEVNKSLGGINDKVVHVTILSAAGTKLQAAKNQTELARIDGARALGGPVAAGGAYLVGERGPEVFVPRQTGTIVPHGAGAGRGNVEVNLYLDSVKVAKAMVEHGWAQRTLAVGVNRYNARMGNNGARLAT